MSPKQREFAPSYWVRERLLSDANEDSRITHVASRVYRKLFDSYNWKEGHAKCTASFVLKHVPVSERSVRYACKSLIETGRIWIIRRGGRRGTSNLPTLYGINLYYRGSDRFRDLNGGLHAIDFRDSRVVLPDDHHLASLSLAPNVQSSSIPNVQSNSDSQGPNLQNLHPNLSSKEDDIGAPIVERGPVQAAHGGGAKDLKSDETRRVPSGFATWRIVHAEYVGRKGAEDDEKDFLLVHMRNVRGSKFTLRCHVDSDDYASLDEALGIDGDPDGLKGNEVLMSTNREGPKTFMRARPLPWIEVTILEGETCENGSARIRVEYHDNGSEGRITMSAGDANALASACGGEDQAIGARVRYRILPDDALEFRLLVASATLRDTFAPIVQSAT